MIEFSCLKCGRTMKVADTAAGKKGQCKTCGAAVMVPTPDDADTDLQSPLAVSQDNPVLAPRATPPAIMRSTPHVTAVQVNVKQPSNVAHSLGIASIILGILALMVAWIPLLGLVATPLGILGLLLGSVAVVIAFARKGSGIGFAIAGSTISALALLIGFSVNYVLFSGAVGQAREAARRTEANREARELAARLNPPGAPVGPVVPVGNGEVAAPIADAPQKQAEPPEKPADAWATAGMTAENETVRVEVESVVIGEVKLKDFRGESSSENELLQIKVRITNKSDARKLNYDSWSASHGGFLDAGSLRDDLDNTYKRISFGLSDKVVGQLRSESIYPSKSVSDLLVFEVPIDKARFLKLMLPVRAYGGRDEDELKLKIPTRVILSSSSPVRADDAEDEAVAFVEKWLKGTIKRDQSLPGKPVIAVSLSETQVTDVELTKLAGLKNLITLDLGYTQVTDAGLKELAGLENLAFLGLDETQVTDVGLKELTALKNLDALALGFTKVTDAGVKDLVGLKNLTRLVLSETQVTDAGVKELTALKNLTTLDLYGTQVTDVGLKELAALKKLTTLTLSNTKVTDAGVKKLQNALPKCKIVK